MRLKDHLLPKNPVTTEFCNYSHVSALYCFTKVILSYVAQNFVVLREIQILLKLTVLERSQTAWIRVRTLVGAVTLTVLAESLTKYRNHCLNQIFGDHYIKAEKRSKIVRTPFHY